MKYSSYEDYDWHQINVRRLEDPVSCEAEAFRVYTSKKKNVTDYRSVIQAETHIHTLSAMYTSFMLEHLQYQANFITD